MGKNPGKPTMVGIRLRAVHSRKGRVGRGT